MIDKGEELKAEYAQRFEKSKAYRDRVWRILCRRHFSRYVASDAAVLDLGCGWGEFSNNVVARERFAMDLNPDAGSRLRPGIRFLHQDCSAAWPLPDAYLDVVFTSNFLEHLPDKEHIGNALAQAHRCLKPGGRLVCLGPNIRYVAGRYWDYRDHYVALNDQSLCEALKLGGFSIDACIPRFIPYSMSHGWKPPVFLVDLYLRIPFAWPLFGKQFLVIGRK